MKPHAPTASSFLAIKPLLFLFLRARMLTGFGLRMALRNLFGRTILRFTFQLFRMLTTFVSLAHLDSPPFYLVG